ncbi:MAG: hypothetical protein A4E62_01919 [Syntrophorhabdus sp. PtaU1.Bin002]|nr:MAG: hypothetical protein A4E62_01919 [Syntrophorhabdus sp. PtaU1.Bin002]
MEGEPQDGCCIGVHLFNDRFVDVCGQLCPDRGDFFPYILNCKINVPFEDKFNGYHRRALCAHRGNGFDPIDGVYGLLDLVRNVNIHDLRTGALQSCGNVDDGQVYFREEVNANVRVAHYAKHNEDQDEHGRKNRTFYRCIG